MKSGISLKRVIGCSTPEFTLVDSGYADIIISNDDGGYSTADEPNSNMTLKSSDRLKQEVNNERTSLVLFKF